MSTRMAMLCWTIVNTAIGYLGAGQHAVAGPGAADQVGNETLRRVLSTMSPDLAGMSLSAICIRKEYSPRILKQPSSNGEAAPKLKTALTSEILLNNTHARESVWAGDNSQAKDHSNEFARNNTGIRFYDSSSKLGIQKVAPRLPSDALQFVLSPDACTRRGKFLSQGTAAFLSKLKGATVSKESLSGTRVILEGTYQGADPERYFEIEAIPSSGYSITKLTEYDSRKRILLKIIRNDFEHVAESGAELWIPKTVRCERYIYDTQKGNSLHVFEMDIRNARLVATSDEALALNFPSDAARVRDFSIDEDIHRLGGRPSDLNSTEIADMVSGAATFKNTKQGSDARIIGNIPVPPVGDTKHPANGSCCRVASHSRSSYILSHVLFPTFAVLATAICLGCFYFGRRDGIVTSRAKYSR